MSFEPVFLLAGQSNMVGRCRGSDNEIVPGADDNHQHDCKFQLCWENDCNFGPGAVGDWGPLRCQYSPGLDMACFGPEMGIAETLQCKGGRAHFLKFAMGSTNLHSNWNPNNENTVGNASSIGYYKKFIEFCRESLEKLNKDLPPSGDEHRAARRLVGMFWLQGESDSSKAKDANAYLSNLKSFLASVRHDLDEPDMTVAVSPVVWKRGKKVAVVNTAFREAVTAIPHCICIEELEDPQLMSTDEGSACADHLAAESILEIGRRMGRAFPPEALRASKDD